MKNLLTGVLAFLTITSFAQGEYNYESTWWLRHNKSIVYNVPGVKNKTVDITTTRIKNEKKLHYKKQYDSNGNLTKYSKVIKGKELTLSQNSYDDRGNVLHVKQFKENGKPKEELKIERNTEGKKLKLERYQRGKLKYTKNWNYKPEGCIEMSTTHKSNGKLSYKWIYEYYSECDKKRSVLLKANGKVKKEWTYDCKQEGEQLEKKKDVTQVCKWEEVDGDYLVKVYQSLNGKGKTYKTVSTYRSSDTAIVKVQRYNDKEELTSTYTYDFSYKKPLAYAYYRKGKPRYETIYTYENGSISSYLSKRKSKVTHKAIYVYNEDNQLTQMKSFKKGEELSRITEISYN
ncbi:MAG: hypothetical protein JKY48_04070 [Flavobacteriales bacterium]|nr:hypothetical protein [Flavobacteriales bacterium]